MFENLKANKDFQIFQKQKRKEFFVILIAAILVLILIVFGLFSDVKKWHLIILVAYVICAIEIVHYIWKQAFTEPNDICTSIVLSARVVPDIYDEEITPKNRHEYLVALPEIQTTWCELIPDQMVPIKAGTPVIYFRYRSNEYIVLDK